MSKTYRNQAGYRRRPAQGKGDAPRNLGPEFRDNYEDIDWGREKTGAKPTKNSHADPDAIP